MTFGSGTDIQARYMDVFGFFNIVVCLYKFIHASGAIPLKNVVLALCRSIRSINSDCRIFIANLPPAIQRAPVLGKRIPELNEEILEVVLSTNRLMKKVHLLSIYEHLMGSDNKIASPVQRYYCKELEFTCLGCGIFREIVLCEIGAKPYWFEDSWESIEQD